MASDEAEVLTTNKPEEKVQGVQSVHGTRVGQLVEDVRQLATYAIQTGQLPKGVNIETVYTAHRDLEQEKELSPEVFAGLVNDYQVLERYFPTITARSLAATEPEKLGKIRTSPAGRYLVNLWVWTGVIVLAILLLKLSQYLNVLTRPPPGKALTGSEQILDLIYQVLKYLEPFLYGALGAFLYILRVSEERLRTREFDPARAPEHVNRLVLGTLAGGSIILFITQVPTADGGAIKISAAALGFLAGYSVDFLFETLDRIIRAILPKVGLETIERRAQRRRGQDLIRRYQTLLDEAQDEATKKLLQQFVDDLQTP
jgi:hypothetical protein